MRCDTSTGYPREWPIISMLVRYGREDGRCAFCNAPDQTLIRRNRRRPGIWRLVDAGELGTLAGGGELAESLVWLRPVRVTLTVAHLDHTPGNCDPSNLAALCNRCHLHWDRNQHAESLRRFRRARLEAAGQAELALTPGPRSGIVR